MFEWKCQMLDSRQLDRTATRWLVVHGSECRSLQGQCHMIEIWVTWFQLMTYYQKNLFFCQSLFNSFLCLFYVLILTWHVLAVSHLTVTLGMMSDNCRAAAVISVHWPIDQAGKRYCSDRREIGIMAVIWQQVMLRCIYNLRINKPIEESIIYTTPTEKIDLRLSFIILAVSVRWETAITSFFYN